MSTLVDTFRPLLDAATGIAVDDPERARTELARRLDPKGPGAAALNAKLIEHLDRGEIAERGAPPVKYGRVSKAVPETNGFSIDVVHMSGPGPRHLHPEGEINYCVALDGEPTFMGQAPGWVVEPPGSEHVPTVAGGTMLIVYLLPKGRIEFR
jgi:hypothetical protein